MEQILDIETPAQKIYKDRAIWLGTFLGGPLAAGYLIAQNFEAFGESHKATKTWVYAILATVLVFGGVFMIPETVEIPNQIIPFVYTGIASYLVHLFQGQKHCNAYCKRRSIPYLVAHHRCFAPELRDNRNSDYRFCPAL
jgi:hypothetical protein